MADVTRDETRLGRYRLRERLGQGGMAELFLATQEGPAGFEKEVVIKRVLPHLRDEPRFLAMFIDEARLCALLSHPNLVQVTDFGEVDEVYFLAMERLVGLDLTAILRAYRAAERPFPIPIAARIISAACEGLHHAHTLTDGHGHGYGIVHRDVSPSNLFVTDQGTVKVLDFGIAKARLQTLRTEAGQIKGKFHYMSPEQVQGEDLDARSDVFSLGVVLYEMIAATRPFEGEGTLAVLQAVAEARVTPPRTLRLDLPPSLEAILLRALERDRARRFQSADELRGALEDYLADGAGPAASSALRRFMLELREELDGPKAARETRILTPTARRAGAGAGGRREDDAALPAELARTTIVPARKAPPPDASAAAVAPRPPRRGARRVWLVAAAMCLGIGALVFGRCFKRVEAIQELVVAPSLDAAPVSSRPPPPPAPSKVVLPSASEEGPPPEAPRLEQKAEVELKEPARRGSPSRAGVRRAPPQDVASGLLSVGCEPQDCHVYLDGEDLQRDTPIFNLGLPPGVHEVLVVQSGTGARRAKRIDVPARRPVKAMFHF